MRLFIRGYLLFAVLATSLFAQTAVSSKRAFALSPAELQKAFADVKPGSNPVTILTEEATYEFDASGKFVHRHYLVFKAWTKQGAENWAMLQRYWSPWQEDRPLVRARVVGEDGSVHELDPKTVIDAAAKDGDADVISDKRMVKAPLPAMQAGSVVEQEVIEKQTQLSLPAGTTRYFYFGSSVPVEHTVVRIEGPESIPFRFKTSLLPELKIQDSKANGTRSIVLEQGPMKPVKRGFPYLPPEEPRSPHITFSTAKDWAGVASDYSALVEQQLRGFNAATYLPKFPVGADRETKIRLIVEKMNRDIRYTGMELAEASVVPHNPADTIRLQYGDCKDKSILTVALLRAAGMDASVALLLSSYGEDIEPELPGMDIFNHAITYVPGNPAIWLDATDPDLRIGVVSPPNQGRWALITNPKTTALVKTPELTAADNRIIETREFTLSEMGRAKVTETSETYGIYDREYRAAFGAKDSKAIRESMKDYIATLYGETKTGDITHSEGTDLSKPFRMKVEMADVQRGVTARSEAVVAILPMYLTERLPGYFTKPKKEPKAGDKKTDDLDDEESDQPESARKQDFYINDSFTNEWNYKITVPAGFRLRQLPETRDEALGSVRFHSEFKVESDHQTSGILRLVMDKHRLTAAEGFALRDALVEFRKGKNILIYFDQIGESDLSAGKVKEALIEFASLKKQHPTESLHSLQYARALLAAGAGESARAEARAAVQLEPRSAKAHNELAEILKHDLVGRVNEAGFDRDGAVAEYRKALDLDPDDAETRANLAILLEFDENAVRYGAGARLPEAITEYEKILEKLSGLNIPQNYPISLFRAGQYEKLRTYLKKQPESELNRMLTVSVEAVLSGSKAGIAATDGLSGAAAKQKSLFSAAQQLLIARRYDLAADLAEAASQGSPNPAAVAAYVQILRKTKQIAEPSGPIAALVKQPEDAILVFIGRSLFFEKHSKDLSETISPLCMKESDVNEFAKGFAAVAGKISGSGLSREAVLDVFHSSTQFNREGSDESGYVVRLSVSGGENPLQNQAFLIGKEDGTYRVLGFMGQFAGVARNVLRLVDAGKLDQARHWLDLVRREVPAGGGDDPLSGPMFARLWQRESKGDAAAIRRAAASLIVESQDGLELKLLEDALPAADAAVRPFVAASLAEARFNAKQYDKCLVLAEGLLKELSPSPTALYLTLRAAYATGGAKEAARVIAANRERFSQDAAASRVIAGAAMAFDDMPRAIETLKSVISSGRSSAEDYNNLAWAELVLGKIDAATAETATRGLQMTNNASTALLHTLAAVDASLGKPSEARALILQRIKAKDATTPDDNDWLVFGLIAEQYGLSSEAVSMYKRLEKPKQSIGEGASSYALARKRLAALGVK